MEKIGILHTADLHYKSGDLDYLKDISLAVDKMCEVASQDDVDIITIAGDLFDEQLPVGSVGVINAIDAICRLASKKPVVILRGTTTHDVGDSILIFDKLKTKFPVRVIFNSGIYNIITPSNKVICFYCMPGIKKKMFSSLADQLNINIAKATSAELVELQIKQWGKEKILNNKFDAKVFLGHFLIKEKEFENMGSGYEPLVSTDLINSEINPSLILLGHIHGQMRLGNVFYAGSPVAGDMNDSMVIRASDGKVISDRTKKGFYLHKRDTAGNWTHSFIETGQRKYLKIVVTAFDDLDILKIKELIEKYGCCDKQVIASLYIEVTGDKVDIVHVFNDKLKSALDKNVSLLPPKIKVISFDISRRVTDSESWIKLSDAEKFFVWAESKGYKIDEIEKSDYITKINSL